MNGLKASINAKNVGGLTSKMTSEASIPLEPAYSYSLKLEETAKGVRISVHIYAHDTAEALEEAFKTYLNAKIKAIDNKIPLAPVDSR